MLEYIFKPIIIVIYSFCMSNPFRREVQCSGFAVSNVIAL